MSETQIFSNIEKNVDNFHLGNITKVKINSNAIIPILADKIYQNPLSAIRELYNNEVTACLKSKNPDAFIEISLDENTRELSIRGINSLGISHDDFDNVLSVMGNSGNQNEFTSGLFGIGFFSFVKLSENMIIITKGNNFEYAKICKGAIEFEDIPKENYTELEKNGTRIILNVKNGINLGDLKEYISKMIEIKRIKTVIKINNEFIEITQFDDIMQLFKFNHSNYFNKDFPDYSLSFKFIQNEDFDLILYKCTKYRNENRTWLISQNIELDSNENFNFYMNIKNERKFTPTPDRERFEQKSINAIYKILDKLDLEIPNYNTVKEKFEDKSTRFFYGRDYYVKSLLTTERNREKTLEIVFEDINFIPKDYLVFKSYNYKKIREYYNNQILAVCSKNISELTEYGFKYISKKTTIQKPNRKISKTPKKFHSYFRTADKIQNHEFGFYQDDLELKNLLTSYRVFITLRTNSLKALEISEIPNILKDAIFFTNKGIMVFEEIIKNKHIYFIENFKVCLPELIGYEKDDILFFICEEYQKDLISLFLKTRILESYNNTIRESFRNNLLKIKPELKYLIEKCDNIDVKDYVEIKKI